MRVYESGVANHRRHAACRIDTKQRRNKIGIGAVVKDNDSKKKKKLECLATIIPNDISLSSMCPSLQFLSFIIWFATNDTVEYFICSFSIIYLLFYL